MEGGIDGSGNMLEQYAALIGLLEDYDLPLNPLNIDEYGIVAEQCPAGSAWWIAQFERLNTLALRGNWLSGWELHDFLSSLLWKTDASTDYTETGTGYWPNGEWWVYNYYTSNMTGYRVGSTPSDDAYLDTYAVVGSDRVRVLCGVRTNEGTWQITIDDLSSVGLPEEGSLEIFTYGFPFTGGATGTDVPVDLGWVAHTYSDNSVTFPIYQVDEVTAYAFEFLVG